MTYETLALQAASAQARYDWQADVTALAGKMGRFLQAGLFVPGCVGPDGRAAIACAGACGPVRPGRAAAFARGVFFPQALAGREAVPALGLPAAPDAATLQPLRENEGCAVGFIDLAAHLRTEDGSPGVDWARLGHTAEKAVFFLDSCIDVAQYPDAACSRASRAARKLALGAFGLAEVLAALGLAYDSPPARALAARLFACITAQARAASRALAKERRAFPLFAESRLAGGAPMRNAMCTGLAPSDGPARAAGRTPGICPMDGDDVPARARLQMQAAVEAQVDGTAAVPLYPAGQGELQQLCVEACRMGCTLACLGAPPKPAGPAFPAQGPVQPSPFVPEPAEQEPPAPEPPAPAQKPAPAGIRFCPACGSPVHPGPDGPLCPLCGPLRHAGRSAPAPG